MFIILGLIYQVLSNQYCYIHNNITKIYPTLNEFYTLNMADIFSGSQIKYELTQLSGDIKFGLNQTFQQADQVYSANMEIISYAQNQQFSMAAILMKNMTEYYISVNYSFPLFTTPQFKNVIYLNILNLNCYQILLTVNDSILVYCQSQDKLIFITYSNNSVDYLYPNIDNFTSQQFKSLQFQDPYLYMGFYYFDLSFEQEQIYQTKIDIYLINADGIPSINPIDQLNSTTIPDFQLKEFKLYNQTLWVLNQTQYIYELTMDNSTLILLQEKIYSDLGNVVAFNVVYNYYFNQLQLIFVNSQIIQVFSQQINEKDVILNSEYGFNTDIPLKQPIGVTMDEWFVFLTSKYQIQIITKYNFYPIMPFQPQIFELYVAGYVQTFPFNTYFILVNEAYIAGYSLQTALIYGEIDRVDSGQLNIITTNSVDIEYDKYCQITIDYQVVFQNDTSIYQQILDIQVPTIIQYPIDRTYYLDYILSGPLIKLSTTLKSSDHLQINDNTIANFIITNEQINSQQQLFAQIFTILTTDLTTFVQFSNYTLFLTNYKSIDPIKQEYQVEFQCSFDLGYPINQILIYDLIQINTYIDFYLYSFITYNQNQILIYNVYNHNNSYYYINKTNSTLKFESNIQQLVLINIYLITILDNNHLYIYTFNQSDISNTQPYLWIQFPPDQIPNSQKNSTIQIRSGFYNNDNQPLFFILASISQNSINVSSCIINVSTIEVLSLLQFNDKNSSFVDVILIQGYLILQYNNQLLQYSIYNGFAPLLLKTLPLYGFQLTNNSLFTDSIHLFVVVQNSTQLYTNIYKLSNNYHDVLYQQLPYIVPTTAVTQNYFYNSPSFILVNQSFYNMEPNYYYELTSADMNSPYQSIEYQVEFYSSLSPSNRLVFNFSQILINSYLGLNPNQEFYSQNNFDINMNSSNNFITQIDLIPYFDGPVIEYTASSLESGLQQVRINNFVTHFQTFNQYLVEQFYFDGNILYFQTPSQLLMMDQSLEISQIVQFDIQVYGPCPILSIDPISNRSLSICNLDGEYTTVVDLSLKEIIFQKDIYLMSVSEAQIIGNFVFLVGIIDLIPELYQYIYANDSLIKIGEVQCKKGVQTFQYIIFDEIDNEYALVWSCIKSTKMNYQMVQFQDENIVIMTDIQYVNISDGDYIMKIESLVNNQDSTLLLVLMDKQMDMLVSFDKNNSQIYNPQVKAYIPLFGNLVKTYKTSSYMDIFGILYQTPYIQTIGITYYLLIYNLNDLNLQNNILQFFTGYCQFPKDNQNIMQFAFTNFNTQQSFQPTLPINNSLIFYSQPSQAQQLNALSLSNYMTLQINNTELFLTNYQFQCFYSITNISIMANNHFYKAKITGVVNNTWINTQNKQKKNRLTTHWWTWLVIAILILLIVVAIFFFCRKRKQEKQQKEDVLLQEFASLK